MPIKTLLSDCAYPQKPTPFETSILVNQLTSVKARNYLAPVLASMLGEQGFACRPAVCGRNEALWVEQQLFILDFDHVADRQTTHDRIIEVYRNAGYPACFSYWSYSHRDETPRFHVAFCAERPIQTLAHAKAFARHLFAITDGIADPIHDRLYMLSYGGVRGLACTDYAVIPFDAVSTVQPVADGSASVKISKRRNISDLDTHVACIRTRDVEGLRAHLSRNGNNNPLGE